MTRNSGSVAIVTTALTVGVLVSCLFGSMACAHKPSAEEFLRTKVPDTLPENFRQELDRFTFINRATSETLKEFRVLGGAVGTYVQGGTIFDNPAQGNLL